MKLLPNDIDIAARRAAQYKEGLKDNRQPDVYDQENAFRGVFWSVVIGFVMFIGASLLGYATVQIGKIIVNLFH